MTCEVFQKECDLCNYLKQSNCSWENVYILHSWMALFLSYYSAGGRGFRLGFFQQRSSIFFERYSIEGTQANWWAFWLRFDIRLTVWRARLCYFDWLGSMTTWVGSGTFSDHIYVQFSAPESDTKYGIRRIGGR